MVLHGNNQFRQAKDILCDLVDIISKNGCLLLNVGPKADGTISDQDEKGLHITSRLKSDYPVVFKICVD